MNSLCGFIPQIIPAEVKGTIKINGRDDLNTLQLARQISMVHQDPETQFCTETVEDEMAFGLENRMLARRKIDKRIETTLRDLNCSDLRYRSLHTLSGGEKQKIAIASMLVLNPKVLILDEPTSNLDSVSMEEVLGSIENVSRRSEELTIIIAEHRIGDLESKVDRVLRMENGVLGRVIDDFRDLPTDQRKTLTRHSYPEYARRVNRYGKTVLNIKGLNCRVNGRWILREIDLKVRKNEMVALMGRNGSGKTTLIKHIAGLLEVQEGEIYLAGENLNPSRSIPPWRLGRKLGYVFQNPNHQIFENTVEKEMLFGPNNFGKGIENGEKKLMDMENEGVGRKTHPHCMSFGQKRRLNIHSSSLHDPELIIVDEPFTGQDHENGQKIAGLFYDYHRMGTTLIIVTHDPEFARKFCTRAVVMEDGRVVHDGDPKVLEGILW